NAFFALTGEGLEVRVSTVFVPALEVANHSDDGRAAPARRVRAPRAAGGTVAGLAKLVATEFGGGEAFRQHVRSASGAAGVAGACHGASVAASVAASASDTDPVACRHGRRDASVAAATASIAVVIVG